MNLSEDNSWFSTASASQGYQQAPANSLKPLSHEAKMGLIEPMGLIH